MRHFHFMKYRCFFSSKFEYFHDQIFNWILVQFQVFLKPS